jgi:hypothetical protein
MIGHPVHTRTRCRFGVMSIASSLAGLSAAFVMLLGSGGVARAAPDISAIAPDIRVDPVTPYAAASGTLLYKMQIHNDNTASEDLRRVDITLSYDPNTLTLINSKLRDSSDFVSKVGGGKATVQFGKIEQQDERSATLIFRVNPAVADGAPIYAEEAHHWWAVDADGTGDHLVDNVIATSSNIAASALIVPNSGPAGTIYQVVATLFGSEERVVTWLNTPTAVQGLALAGTADAGGNIQLQFDSAGLAPGYYGLVLHGLDSGREYVLPFAVAA